MSFRQFGGLQYNSKHNSVSSNFNTSKNLVVSEEAKILGSGNSSIYGTLEIRQTKLYNEVKYITTNTTLAFPLEESCLIRTTSNITITLPLVTTTCQNGATFNFIKASSTTNSITFTAQGTNLVVLNGSVTGSTSSVLMPSGTTAIQLVIVDFTDGVYNWVVL